MIFADAGHPVSQDEIVKRGYGSIVNQPGGIGQILNALNTSWTDNNGVGFKSKTSALFCPDIGRMNLSNPDIISTLSSNQPMLYCNLTHAMVLFQVNYTPPSNVGAAVVVDPMPGMGVRQLTPMEMVPVPYGQMRMLARIEIA